MHFSKSLRALGYALNLVARGDGAAIGDVKVMGAMKDSMTSQPTEVYDDVHDQLSKRSGFREGFVDFGHDGVARIYACNGTIFDALRLSNQQLMAVVKARGDPVMEEGFKGVSRHDVPEGHLLDPPIEVRLPYPQADDHSNSPLDLCTPPSAANENTAPQSSPNPQSIVKRNLQPRARLFCKYQECKTNEACLFLGCQYCGPVRMSKWYKFMGLPAPGPH